MNKIITLILIFAAATHVTINSMELNNKSSIPQAITLSEILQIRICDLRNGWKQLKTNQQIQITKDEHKELPNKLSRLKDIKGKKYLSRESQQLSIEPGLYTLAADSLYNTVPVVFDHFDQNQTHTAEALHLVLMPSSSAKQDAIIKYNLSIIYLETYQEYKEFNWYETKPSCFELTKKEK